MIAIDPLEWPGVNVAFLTAFIASIVLTFAVIPYGKRRPVGRPMSWGEAMLASGYAFGVMFLAFGIVPHQWIDHADRNLGWSRDRIVMGPGGVLKPEALGGWVPLTITYEGIRDIVVVVLYRDLLRAAHLHLVVVAEARSGQDHRDRGLLVRPAASEEGITRWHAPTPIRR